MKSSSTETNTQQGGCLQKHLRMKWEIGYVEDRRFIEVKTTGAMGFDENKKLCEEMLAAGRIKKVNAFLVDQKETAFGLSVFEIDRLPELFSNLGFGIMDKTAILVNADSTSRPLLSFLQDVFGFSSLRVCIFTDSQEAVAWLKKRV